MGPSSVFYAAIADAVQRVRLPCSSSADLLQQVFPLPDGWISEIPSGISILGAKSPLRTTLRWRRTIAYRFNSGCWQSLCRPAMLYQDGISFLVRKMCSGPWRSWRVFKFSLTSASVLEMIKQIWIVICQWFGILWYTLVYWRLKNVCLILSYHSVLTYHSIFSAKSLEVSLKVFPFCHLPLRHFCHLPLLPSLHFLSSSIWWTRMFFLYVFFLILSWLNNSFFKALPVQSLSSEVWCIPWPFGLLVAKIRRDATSWFPF